MKISQILQVLSIEDATERNQQALLLLIPELPMKSTTTKHNPTPTDTTFASSPSCATTRLCSRVTKSSLSQPIMLPT